MISPVIIIWLHLLLAVEECVSPWCGTLVSFAFVPVSLLRMLSRYTNTWRMKVNLRLRPNHWSWQCGVQITVFPVPNSVGVQITVCFQCTVFPVPNSVGVHIAVLVQFVPPLESLCFSGSSLCWRPNHCVFPVPNSVGVQIQITVFSSSELPVPVPYQFLTNFFPVPNLPRLRFAMDRGESQKRDCFVVSPSRARFSNHTGRWG